MTSSPEIPDSVSPNLLRSFARQARNKQDNPPIGTAVPKIPFGKDDSGPLDLVITIEQVIRHSDGCSPLQMLQAAVYLIDSSIGIFKEQLTGLSRNSDPISMGITLRLLGDVAKLLHSKTIIEEMIAPITCNLIGRRAPGIDWLSLVQREQKEGIPLRIQRNLLISDSTLQALGIPVEDFDLYFQEEADEASSQG